jgi:hypothetical protein
MPVDIPNELRQLVAARADYRCEYCLMPQSASLHKYEPDHIVSRQHDGNTVADNLALACWRCNRNKGPNVGSFDPETGALIQFFNPRRQMWNEHFDLIGGFIQPLTPEARVTVKILRINDEDRLTERRNLMEAGLYE